MEESNTNFDSKSDLPVTEVPVPEKLSLGQIWALSIGAAFVLALFGGGLWVCFSSGLCDSTPPAKSLLIRSADKDITVSQDRGDYKVSYLNNAGEKESFYISKDAEETPSSDPLTLALARLAETTGAPKFNSPFSGVDGGHKIVNITLDVSGSTRNLIKTKSDYYSGLLSRIKNMLGSSDINLRPGDEIRVGFIGRSLGTGAGFKQIQFDGPNFVYNLSFSARKQINVLDLKRHEVAKSEFRITDEPMRVSSVSEVIEAIDRTYEAELKRNDKTYAGTYLIDHIKDISQEAIDDRKFSSVVYILSTDGIFNVSRGLNVGVTECSIATYVKCHPAISVLRKNGKLPSLKTLNGNLDRAYVIGIDAQNDLGYRDSLDTIMRALLEPISEENIEVTT